MSWPYLVSLSYIQEENCLRDILLQNVAILICYTCVVGGAQLCMHSMWKPAISSSFKWLSSTCEQTGALGAIAILYSMYVCMYVCMYMHVCMYNMYVYVNMIKYKP